MATRPTATEIDVRAARNRKAWKGDMGIAKPATARRKSRPEKPITPEKDVLAACLQLLTVHPKVAFAFRANAGAMQNPRGQWVKFGFKGMVDISGMLKGGRRLEVEVKRPGKLPSADQNAFLYRVNRDGGWGVWVDSVDRLDFLLRGLV